MEPSVESLVLHPAVLIASGFEVITSRQVRFLNAHKDHYHSRRVDLKETISILPKDFQLGGLLNPSGYLLDIHQAYRECAMEIDNFPYLTRKAILKHFYLEKLQGIWSELLIELFSDLSAHCVTYKRPVSYFNATKRVIHELYASPIYHKITALHLCGLGDKLSDAFDYIFRLFKKYDSNLDERPNYRSASY